MSHYTQFKSILEYFIAHLEWLQNSDASTVGYQTYILPLIKSGQFKMTGQGYNGGEIQNSIREWEQFHDGVVCINIQGNYGDYRSKKCYLNWKDTGINIIAKWKDNHIISLEVINYKYWENPPTWDHGVKSVDVDSLGLYDGKPANTSVEDLFNAFLNLLSKDNVMKTMKKYIEILRTNKNLILTGAPGTGKTYLAKEIAKEMGAEYKLVQFHPSYDYTDFVEGLRPVKKGETLGFERKDGVFKAFCKEAVSSVVELSFDEAYADLINKIKDGSIKTLKLKTKESAELHVRGVDDSIGWYSERETDNKSSNSVSKSRLQELYKVYNTVEAIEAMSNINKCINDVIGGCDSSYYWGVLRYLVNHIKNQSKPYVLIIDEINRGEISKIFGELFFSIDPGYRGEEHKVDTQYQNLIPREGDPDFDPDNADNADIYRNGFFIPKNVYIIGTMNDIDRSVESMDFAMRRRFAWKEITAESRQSMLDDDLAWGIKGKPSDDIIKQIKTRMNNLNAAIVDQYSDELLSNKDKIGLSKAYQIGASYFLKYGLYKNFDDLWTNHIEGLLYEYLRGKTNIDEKIKWLRKAYNDTVNHRDTAEN